MDGEWTLSIFYIGFFETLIFFLKMEKHSTKSYFQKLSWKVFPNQEYMHMKDQRTLSGVYVCKIWSGYLKNGRLLIFSMSKIVSFHDISWDCWISIILKFCPIYAVQKHYYGHFLHLWRQTVLKTCIDQNFHPKFSVYPFFIS